MGYSIKDQVNGLLILMGIKSEKIMANKADEIRTLLIEGASTSRIVLAIMKRCKEKHSQWLHAAVAQTKAVLDIPLPYAQALVSEYSGKNTKNPLNK